MYYTVSGKCLTKTSVLGLKGYISKDGKLTQSQKDSFGLNAIKEELTGFKNKKLGSYVGVKDINVESITTGVTDYHNCEISAQVKLYFCKIEPNQIVEFAISSIEPNRVIGNYEGYLIQIPLDQLSTSPVSYSSTGNLVLIGSNLKLKEQDYVRAKITGVYNPYTVSGAVIYKCKATCKNLGAGKLS